MPIYKVAITQDPSVLEAQAGKVEEIVLSSVEVVANSKEQAIALAVLQNCDKLKADTKHDMARCKVQVGQAY